MSKRTEASNALRDLTLHEPGDQLTVAHFLGGLAATIETKGTATATDVLRLVDSAQAARR